MHENGKIHACPELELDRGGDFQITAIRNKIKNAAGIIAEIHAASFIIPICAALLPLSIA
jgi:hypothetical protein